jgi:hypothetical protein
MNMEKKKCLWFWPIWIILFCQLPVAAQNPDKLLTMTDALQIASANYLIQSKVNYTRSSSEAVQAAKKVALPDFILAAADSLIPTSASSAYTYSPLNDSLI